MGRAGRGVATAGAMTLLILKSLGRLSGSLRGKAVADWQGVVWKWLPAGEEGDHVGSGS